MNGAGLAVGLGAAAVVGGGTFLANGSFVRALQRTDDPTAAILPTLTFAAWGGMIGLGGLLAMNLGGTARTALYGAAALGAGVGMFGGGMAGLAAGVSGTQALRR